MTFNFYSLWIDPIFYISVAVFVLFLFLLVYSIRRYMAIGNSEQEEPVNIEVLQKQEIPLENVSPEIPQEQEMEMPIENLEQESLATEVLEQEEVMETPVEEPILAEQETEGMVGQTPVLQEQVIADTSEAEGFVKGIFNGISDIDERLKAVESTLSERKLNGDFALRYLEDIIDEYESMDKTGVKSRIEYLIADLKK